MLSAAGGWDGMGRGGKARQLFGLLALFLVFAVSHAKKSKRWTYPRPQWPVPEHTTAAHPCRLFLWDVVSAFKFCECSRLVQSTVKTSLWEDSHKQLWLRVPYASPLLRVFPCQQHSLSRCAKCGHDYREHVEWAAEKSRDRPFDRLLRKTSLVGTENASLDYREVSVLLKNEAGGGGLLGGGWGKQWGSSTSISGSKNNASSKENSRGKTNSDRVINAGGLKNAGGQNAGRKTSGSKTLTSQKAGDVRAQAATAGGNKPAVEEVRRSRTGSVARGSTLLAALAEAQRTTLLQLSGVSVTSAVARAGFEEARESERRAAEKREKASRRSGGGGGGGGDGTGARSGRGARGGSGGASSRGTRNRRRSSRSRGRRGGREGDGGRDSWGSGAGGGVTDRQVAERNVRAFDQVNFV